MTKTVYKIDPLDGQPLPKSGQLYKAKKRLNLWCSRESGNTIKISKGSIVMIVQACHVEVEEEPFWDVDDEFSDSDDWESWHEMRLDVLYNEKVYKDVESGFYMWKERMIEVTPSTKSDEEA